MMRFIFGILIYILLFINILYSQTTATEIPNKFFELYETRGAEKALDYVFSTNKWINSNPETVGQIKGKLIKAIALVGNYHGFELIIKKQIGKSYILLSYMLKYDRQPIQFTFILYKPEDIWQIQNLQFDDKFIDDLQETGNSIIQE